MLSEYLTARKRAQQQYDAAFYLLTVTFPTAKDPKLLMGVLYNIFSSLESTMETILLYERELHLVPTFHTSFRGKLTMFCSKSLKRNKIPPEMVTLMTHLNNILELHKKSPIEFQRDNRLIICSNDYELTPISLHNLREYLSKSKHFLEIADNIIKMK